MSMIEIKSVTHTFSGGTTALAGVDLSIEENEFVSLVGRSGCGKSTLLMILAGLVIPSEGEVAVEGAPVLGPGRDRGVVFQQYTLFPWLTAQQNVEFALREAGVRRRDRAGQARENLDLVGLDSFASALPKELSGGMKQRVALARTLAYRPRVLLMDEPFGALDALTRRSTQALLLDVWQAHRLTVLFITHDVDEAVLLSDRVCWMSDRPGRIEGEIEIDLERPRTEDIAVTERYLEMRSALLDGIEGQEQVSGPVVAG